MKNRISILILALIGFITLFAGNMPANSENLRISPLISSIADRSQFNVSAGFFNSMHGNVSYSSLNAGFVKHFSENWTLSYDVGYWNFNMQQNYLRGGLGLRYHNDDFSLSIYLNRSFEAEPLINDNINRFSIY